MHTVRVYGSVVGWRSSVRCVIVGHTGARSTHTLVVGWTFSYQNVHAVDGECNERVRYGFLPVSDADTDEIEGSLNGIFIIIIRHYIV